MRITSYSGKSFYFSNCRLLRASVVLFLHPGPLRQWELTEVIACAQGALSSQSNTALTKKLDIEAYRSLLLGARSSPIHLGKRRTGTSTSTCASTATQLHFGQP